MASVDDTGNDARARKIAEYAEERGWNRYQIARYSIAAGYLLATYRDEKVRLCEAGIVQEFHKQPSIMEDDCNGK
jgi:hypothetical protein